MAWMKVVARASLYTEAKHHSHDHWSILTLLRSCCLLDSQVKMGLRPAGSFQDSSEEYWEVHPCDTWTWSCSSAYHSLRLQGSLWSELEAWSDETVSLGRHPCVCFNCVSSMSVWWVSYLLHPRWLLSIEYTARPAVMIQAAMMSFWRVSLLTDRNWMNAFQQGCRCTAPLGSLSVRDYSIWKSSVCSGQIAGS